MMTDAKEFIFESFEWEPSHKTLSCNYQLDTVKFSEKYIFDFPVQAEIDQQALDQAFQGLWLMAGISYYKAFCPAKIIIKNSSINADQAQFFEAVYHHGLGEFCYQNQIPLLEPEFPSVKLIKNPSNSPLRPEAIIPLGGGKDSLTTVELFQKANIPFVTWTVGEYSGLQATLDIIREENPNHQHLTVKRVVDPTIIELNKNGAYNGHVPISAIWAFLSVCTSLISGKKHIAFSNENSANEPTTQYQGQDINHQYSKSLDFEIAFQRYVKNHIHTGVEYFSALRALDELHIAEIFAQTAWAKHAQHFSSCNRNFHLTQTHKDFFWCGKCPKCVFVFTILAPFIDRDELIKIFEKNCFTDPELKITFNELLGLTNSKPFECVGTVNEVKKALQMAVKNFPEIEDLALQNPPDVDYDFQNLASHHIPDAIWKKLQPLISSNV